MNRRGYLIALGVGLFAGCTGSAEFEPENTEPTPNHVDGARSKSNRVLVNSAEGYYDNISVGVTGVVRNVSDVTLDYVEVVSYFYDSTNTRLGQGLDNATDLAPNQGWEYDASAVDIDPNKVAGWEVVADASVY